MKRRRRLQPGAEPLELRALLATIVVTSLADDLTVDGAVTLREAIAAAETDASVDGSVAGQGPDRIEFADGLTGTISISPGLGPLRVNSDVTIVGHSRTSTIITGESGIFDLGPDEDEDRSVSISLESLTVDGKKGTTAIAAAHLRELTLRDVLVRNSGSGLSLTNYTNAFERPTRLKIFNSRFTTNTRAVFLRLTNDDSVEIVSTEFANNAGDGGGGLHVWSEGPSISRPRVLIRKSTFVNNRTLSPTSTFVRGAPY